jgi:hypothetical protein
MVFQSAQNDFWLMVCIASVGLAEERPLAGVVDFHVHSVPDSTARSIDTIDLAPLAKGQRIGGWC